VFERKDVQKLCFVGGIAWIIAGALGMVLSFVYLASAHMADITAGSSGFLAGAFLMGSGLVSCTLIAALGGDENARRTE
jgi:hypothetical protein